MRSTVKKITIAVLCSLLCFSAASVLIPYEKGYAAATVSDNMFTEDFGGYTPFEADVADGNTTFGDWSVYFDQSEAGKISILSEADSAQYGAEGQVLRINSSPNGGNAGTDHKVVYDKADYKVKNFTASFDFYQIGGSGISSSWIALFARNQDPTTVTNPRSLFLHLQKGKGTRSDEVPTSDGGTRDGETNDIYFQYQSSANTGSGMTHMSEETGIERNMGRFFMTDGGDVVNTWFTVKYVVRDNFASCYMKLKSEADDAYRFLGKTCYSQKFDLNAGYLAFGTCGGDYLIDNLKVCGEDGNKVTAKISAPTDYGEYEGNYVSAITQSTAAENSDIELVLTLKDGYVYGKENGGVWFKDEAMTEAVTPKNIKLQRLAFNDTYAKYEWVDSDVFVESIEDLDSLIGDDENALSIRESYSGSEYRLIVTVNTAENGFDYYALITKRTYYNIVKVTGGGTMLGKIAGETVDMTNGAWRVKIEIGTAIAFEAAAGENYKFAGWYKSLNDGENDYKIRLHKEANYPYTSELGGINIEAVFVPEDAAKVSVSFSTELADGESQNYGSVKTVEGEYYSGEEISLVAEEQKGFSFLRWDVNGEEFSESAICNISLTENVTAKAVFEVEKYRVFVNDGIAETTIERIVTANSEVTLKAPSAPVGKTFSRWVIEGVGTDYNQNADGSVTFLAIGKKIYATAYFVNSTHKVTVNVADTSQGTVLGSGNKQYGDTVTITVKPKEGYAVSRYTVRGVDVSLGENGIITFVMPDNDVSIKVEFGVIDSVETKKEIIAYVIFGVFIVLVAAIMLFIRSDEEGNTPKGGRRKKARKAVPVAVTSGNYNSTKFNCAETIKEEKAEQTEISDEEFAAEQEMATAQEETAEDFLAEEEPVAQAEKIAEQTTAIQEKEIETTFVKKTFHAKLRLANQPLKENFAEIGNELLRYEKVRICQSNKYAAFYYRRETLAKITVTGNSMKLFVALNVADVPKKFKVTDVSDKKRFEKTPCRIKVKSKRSVKYAKTLISMIAEKYGLKQTDKPKTTIKISDYKKMSVSSMMQKGWATVARRKTFINKSRSEGSEKT